MSISICGARMFLILLGYKEHFGTKDDDISAFLYNDKKNRQIVQFHFFSEDYAIVFREIVLILHRERTKPK